MLLLSNTIYTNRFIDGSCRLGLTLPKGHCVNYLAIGVRLALEECSSFCKVVYIVKSAQTVVEEWCLTDLPLDTGV